MKTHKFDPLSLVAGVVLLMLAAAAVWQESFDWNIGVWVLPVAVLVFGIGLLASTLRPSDS
jgi:hypothetical protein